MSAYQLHGNHNLRIAYGDGPKIIFFSMPEIPEVHLKIHIITLHFTLHLHDTYTTLNSRGKPEKTYPSFGTDCTYMTDITESLITGNENIDQNVQLE